MKVTDLRRKLMAALAAGGLLAPGSVYAAAVNTNLVVNPGFENVDFTMLGGDYITPKILQWGGASAFTYGHVGTGAQAPDYANGGPLAGGGLYYFVASQVEPDATAANQFFQTIDVSAGASGTLIASGAANYRLGGFFSGYLAQPDKGTIQVDFLNSGGTLLSSASVTSVDPLTWNEYTVAGAIPVGTATARVSLYGAPGYQGSPSAYIDNVDFQVTNTLPVLSLTVNRGTGNISLNNQTGAAKNISAYTITSAYEALEPANSTWLSIADTYDAGSPGPNQVDSVHNWTEQTVPTANGDLTESDPSTVGASLAAGRIVNLGNAWIKTPTQDLTFSYTSGGQTVVGLVNYVGGPGNVPYKEGDVNTDGVINSADWVVVRTNQNSNLSSKSLAEAYRLGDLTGDKKNNHDDFVAFKSLYNTANGVGAFTAMLTAIPESSSVTLVMTAGLLLAPLARSRRRP